jgi:energy-coupling factor transporter ATP-binding protein EcfA2
VYIRRVTIHNVRGFEDLDLDFTRPGGHLSGWTVLAGRNGSGKSTILKAIALAVTGVQRARVLQETFSGWIRSGSETARVDLTIETSKTDQYRPGRAALGEEARLATISSELSFELVWADLQGETVVGAGWGIPEYIRNEAEENAFSIGELPSPLSGPWAEASSGWFIAGYGPYRRLTGHASEVQRLMAGPDRVARLVNLFREESSLVESVLWLREIYLQRLEGKPGTKALEEAVIALLNDGLLPDRVAVEKVDSSGLWVCQHGVQLPLTQLSDGYRTTAAVVMDVIRHMHQCFGELRIEQAKDDEGTYLQVLHEGVILIDEVDLHLHVSWQKRLGFWLKRHFPNVQFIVTTHSPFVCQAADPKGLIRLPAPGENRPAEHVSEDLYNTVINGSLDEAVLTDLFGLESPYSEQTEKLRERIAELESRLQAGEATPGEEEEFNRLSAQLPQTLPSAVEQALRKLAADV